MKPTILLLGKNGQVGFDLNLLLPALADVIGPDRKELDLLDADRIRRVVRETRPQIIVNAAAYTAVDAAETDEANAYAINLDAVRVLAEESKALSALLVHYSTDYVFDGSKKSPYLESDPTNPLNVYGKSKHAGEIAIRDSGVSHLIFRTSWIYSTRGKNFLLTILRLATEREELRVVSDQTGAPTCAWDVAASTASILAKISHVDEAEFQHSVRSLSGTYHMSAGGETTWYGFAKSILDTAPSISPDATWFSTATRGRPLIAKRIVPIKATEFASPTRRPAYSILSNVSLLQRFGCSLPDWANQLKRCLTAPEPLLKSHSIAIES